jgi:hypothetical protein
MSWEAAAIIGGSILEGKFAKDQARKQMRFQEDMSSTSYQRAMEDMRKAGLNPILAGKLGGASTPPGAMAKSPDFGGTTAKAIAQKNLRDLQKSQINLQNKQGELVDADVLNRSASTAKLLEEARNKKLQNQWQEIENAHNAKDLLNLGELSRLQFKHTVWNAMGTDAYNIAKKAYIEIQDNTHALFDDDHQIWHLPQNAKKKLLNEKVRKQINGKQLTFEDWWSKLKTEVGRYKNILIKKGF